MRVRRIGPGALLAAACALLLGCPSTVVQLGEACAPGTQQSCACPGGTTGIQGCDAQGTGFGACQCAPGGSVSATSSSSASTSGAGGATVGAGGSGGANACAGHIYYAGMYPPVGGMLAYPIWASLPNSDGLTSLDAGNSQCQALGIGADHVCDLTEIQAAAAAHEPLLSAIPQGTTAWLQRTTPVYVEGLSGTPCTAAMAGQTDPNAGDMCVTWDGGVLPCVCALSPPGPGGNCNGWTYMGDHIGDGEYYSFDQQGVPTYHLDNDTIFDPTDPVPHVHPWPDLKCGGFMRAILCCYQACP